MSEIQIELEEMRYYAYHGVLDQERRVGNHFTVSLLITADVLCSTESDALADTISYAEIYDTVADEMAKPSQLLEHVAGRITRRLMADFTPITALTVKLTKHNPPIRGDVRAASIILRSVRQNSLVEKNVSLR